MALIQCKECKKEMSSEAKVCSNCGYKPTKLGCISVAVLALFVVFVFSWVRESVRDHPRPPRDNLTPEQAAVAAKAKERDERRFQHAVAAAATVKKALRNPASVQWEYIGADGDASVICLEYRAQNGFGGINKEFTVFVNGIPSQTVTSWNKNCANKSLNDLTYARRALP